MKGHEVKKILIDKKKAIGVKFTDDQEITGKVVISNADASSTFMDLIGEDSLPSGFLAKLKGMKPSLSYFILYLGIEGGLDELSVSNNEVFFDTDLQKEYQALYENRVPDEASFYLLAPSKVNPSHAPKGKSTLCLSYKVPYHLSPGWGRAPWTPRDCETHHCQQGEHVSHIRLRLSFIVFGSIVILFTLMMTAVTLVG